MNNFYRKGLLCLSLTEKNVRTTKLVLVMLMIVLFKVSANEIYAQSTRLNLNMSNATVKEVLKSIEDKSEFTFFYNDKTVDTKQVVSINVENKQVEEILSIILPGYSYRIENKNIIIIPQSKNGLVSKQQKEKLLTGKVSDNTNEPIIGANVSVKGTTTGTITDIDGNFQITVPENATLLITYIGYSPVEIQIKDQQVVNVVLKEDAQKLEEVVVVGYGTQKKASLTGSISSVKIDDEIRSISSSNMSSVLAGTMAGLKVNNRTGVPGVSSDVTIRTSGSWNAASPVYVIDGVVRDKSDFDRLDVNEVENVTVLKDAASAAIYGSRSSGGVILITTRQGKLGKPQIHYTGSYAVESRGLEMERTTGIETAEMANYIHRNNKGFWAYWDDAELAHMRNLNGGDGYDVIDEYWQAPMSTHHSLGLSGGNERVKYFINGSYFGQSGFLEKMD